MRVAIIGMGTAGVSVYDNLLNMKIFPNLKWMCTTMQKYGARCTISE